MAIELNENERKLRTEIERRLQKAREAIAGGRISGEASEEILEAGKSAHKLHRLLTARHKEPKHHSYMIKNRGLQPDHPDFYMHFHPIEDLLKFLDDEHANDDPEDRTIGAKFKFRIFSNRWGHEDAYNVERTELGWNITFLTIGGPCDKGGRPFLYMNFRHDSIYYPEGIDGLMEWLWNQAESQGLTQMQVQAALQELADWVSKTEKSVPTGGVWEGY